MKALDTHLLRHMHRNQDLKKTQDRNLPNFDLTLCYLCLAWMVNCVLAAKAPTWMRPMSFLLFNYGYIVISNFKGVRKFSLTVFTKEESAVLGGQP